MKPLYFSIFSDHLEWLDPAEYYASPWRYVGEALGADEETYSIVEYNGDYRYTII